VLALSSRVLQWPHSFQRTMAKILNFLKCSQKRGVIPQFSIRQQLSQGAKCPKKLKIMFFGTDDFALQSLTSLHREYLVGGCVKALEVTCLPMKTLTPAVAKYAKDNNLRLHVWPPELPAGNFDLGVVASFGKLIPEKVIATFPLGMVNVHGSLLPRWRGAAPVIHALANGDQTTGVTIMRVRPKKFDIGEVFAMREVEIGESIRRIELTKQLARVGAELLTEVLRDFESSSKLSRIQDCEGVSHAPMVTKEFACIDWENQSNIEVYNLWRAVGDFLKLRTRYSETGLGVRIGTVLHPLVLKDDSLCSDSEEPGTVKFIKRGKKQKYVCVKCREGWVAISDIYYHNKKVMSPTDFYNGFLSKPGRHKLVRDS